MPQRIAFQFPHERSAPREELQAIVRAADDLGYEAVFVPEAWGRDAFTTLGWIAANTANIRLGTGIVNVFSRTPALIAQSIATLDELSNGRAILGLGTSGPVVIESWHGMRFDRGLRRTQEAAEIVRLALSGSRVDYEGEIFKLRHFRLGFRPLRERIPLYLATMGPKNNALAGRIADGWMPTWLPAQGIPAALEEIGARLDVAPCIMACVMDNSDEACDLIRPHIAYYVGGMGTFYRDTVARFGFADEAARIHALWQAGQRKQAIAAVSSELIAQVALAGPADHCRRSLERYRAAGVDLPVIVVPHSASHEVFLRTLESLA